jgi:hypothetical protein
MVQQGQVFELTTRGRDGERLWAYRFRVGGRGSNRIQRGGFASEQDAREALERGPLRSAGSTLAEPRFARFLQSPLPDSNRRPPPYQGASRAGRGGTRGSRQPRKTRKSGESDDNA